MKSNLAAVIGALMVLQTSAQLGLPDALPSAATCDNISIFRTIHSYSQLAETMRDAPKFESSGIKFTSDASIFFSDSKVGSIHIFNMDVEGCEVHNFPFTANHIQEFDGIQMDHKQATIDFSKLMIDNKCFQYGHTIAIGSKLEKYADCDYVMYPALMKINFDNQAGDYVFESLQFRHIHFAPVGGEYYFKLIGSHQQVLNAPSYNCGCSLPYNAPRKNAAMLGWDGLDPLAQFLFIPMDDYCSKGSKSLTVRKLHKDQQFGYDCTATVLVNKIHYDQTHDNLACKPECEPYAVDYDPSGSSSVTFNGGIPSIETEKGCEAGYVKPVQTENNFFDGHNFTLTRSALRHSPYSDLDYVEFTNGVVNAPNCYYKWVADFNSNKEFSISAATILAKAPCFADQTNAMVKLYFKKQTCSKGLYLDLLFAPRPSSTTTVHVNLLGNQVRNQLEPRITTSDQCESVVPAKYVTYDFKRLQLTFPKADMGSSKVKSLIFNAIDKDCRYEWFPILDATNQARLLESSMRTMASCFQPKDKITVDISFEKKCTTSLFRLPLKLEIASWVSDKQINVNFTSTNIETLLDPVIKAVLATSLRRN